MKLNNFLFIFLSMTLVSCKQQNTPAPPPPAPNNQVIPLPNGKVLPPISGANVMQVSVNGSQCAPNTYPDKPCVSVTICTAGDSVHCQTINDILLDTGSVGLRVFKSVMTNPSPAPILGSGGSTIAECVGYGDGSAHWGPVSKVDIQLAGKPKLTNISMQVIDSNFGDRPTPCVNAEISPIDAQMNGILGVGLSQQDCGHDCVTNPNLRQYYACTGMDASGHGGTCTSTALSLANQLQNPIGLFATDNNGFVLSFPDIENTGAPSMDGYLIFGIGTQANNMPTAGLNSFAASSNNTFATQWNGHPYTSFIDSGSNSLGYPNTTNIPTCDYGWFCPPGRIVASATNLAADGSLSLATLFATSDADAFFNSGNHDSKELALPVGGALNGLFDWGFPFYIGRNIYHGLDGKSSSLGAGRYWAY